MRAHDKPDGGAVGAPVIEPNETNGLNVTCRLMADKIATMPRAKLSNRVGRLVDADILRLNRAILVFLGLAG
jgi:mRNA interferase MazF